ncbi:MAG: DUF2971 domain-containing protein [Planctomycetes bacterium]|nr:DUF2971 domain-containing protein [Planctomycetota bacterium]
MSQEEILWHYTSELNLMAIIKNMELWACNLRKMNDPAEIKVGQDVVKKAIKELYTEDIADKAISFLDKLITNSEVSFFCSSFSREGDDLNQWRLYGDNGRGVCIGFHKHKLESICAEITNQASPKNLFRDVVIKDLLYIDKEEVNVRDVANYLTKSLIGCENTAVKIGIKAAEISSTLKAECYKTEKESRLIICHHGLFDKLPAEHDYHLGRYGLTEHIKIPIAKKDNDGAYVKTYNSITTPIKEIIIGPASYTDKADMQNFLRKNRIPVESKKSILPYR